ncbi:MAG: metal ABC transporter ATP-binding protein [SAR324 cluster bacterium]|nr:metal ABC transporter ATP-binding protein [SAR324 cluster bacterium]
MRNTQSVAIEFKDVYFKYQQGYILEKVDFSLRKQDFLLILGPNGGGKTSLLKLIMGINRPTQGKVKVFGEEPHISKPKIGYVPQNIPVNDRFPITVEQVVSLGSFLSNKTLSRHEISQRTKTWLDKVGLTKVAKSRFCEISGGQQQRVIIARVMMSQPEILLLDEPTNNIDIELKDSFCQLLSNISKQVTVVMVTHELSFLPKSVNKIGCVEKKVVIHGSLSSLEEDIPFHGEHNNNKSGHGSTHAEGHDCGHQCMVDYLAHLNNNTNLDIYKSLMKTKT